MVIIIIIIIIFIIIIIIIIIVVVFVVVVVVVAIISVFVIFSKKFIENLLKKGFEPERVLKLYAYMSIKNLKISLRNCLFFVFNWIVVKVSSENKNL